MAVETVPEIPRKDFILPLESVDRGGYLVAGVRAIVNLMACADESGLQPYDGSVPMAAGVVCELLDELKTIIDKRGG